MVDEPVAVAASDVFESLRPLLADAPSLQVGRNWPSLGTLDLCTSMMRGRPFDSDQEREAVRGIASAFGLVAHDAWSGFPGVDVKLELGPAGVRLVARGGDFLERDEDFSIDLEDVFLRLLSEPPSSIPVFGRFYRPYVADDPYFLKTVALGVSLGLPPAGVGGWHEASPDRFLDYVHAAERNLARSCAQYYEKVFPEEPWGQVPELYLNGFVFPPPYMVEVLPGLASVERLGEFIKEYSIPDRQLLKLAVNLLKVPDESLSNLGFIIFATCLGAEQAVPHGVKMWAEMRGARAAALRPAVIELRSYLGKRPDPVAGSVGPGDAEFLRRERDLGFFPWLRLSDKTVARRAEDERVQKLVTALTLLDLAEAKYLTEKMIDSDPSNVELRLQRAFLDIAAGDYRKGHERARAILTEMEGEKVGDVFFYQGLASLYEGDFLGAQKQFERARNIFGDAADRSAEILNNLTVTCLALSDVDNARKYIALISDDNNSSLYTTYQNRLQVARALNDPERTGRIQRELLSLVPTSPEALEFVFGSL